MKSNSNNMKKFFTLLLISAALSAEAQYIPNGSFENWKGSAGESYQASDGSLNGGNSVLGLRQRPGDEPSSWNGSSVNQKVFLEKKEVLVEQVAGYTGNAVQLTNKYVGAMGVGSNAPAFINFGTPWVYAISNVNNCDGGVYGGMSFSHRPDAIEGWYKRNSTSENAHIIVYIWNGTFSSTIQSSVANDVKNDVDRAVMGLTSDIQQSGTLIAKCDYTFTSTAGNDWQKITVPLEYVEGTENIAPEKVNVIISSGDYWTRSNIQDGSTLLVDDVQFVYYSELSSLVYDGREYFVNGKTSYTIDAVYDESKLSVSSNGNGAVIEKMYDSASGVLRITIKGDDYAVNSNNIHTYSVTFTGDEGGGGEVVPTPDPTPGEIDYTPAFTGEKTKLDRWITSIVLESPTFPEEAANTLLPDNSEKLCYNDYSATVTMKAAAGETVAVKMEIGEASWMNAFLYIDLDSDGFTAGIEDGSQYQPSGDLLSYSFYNNGAATDDTGWNSVGNQISGDNRSTVALPSFIVPRQAGLYRVRAKLDWCNIDPAGDSDGKFGDFMDNGGQIVDFMLEVVENEENVPAPDEVDYTPTNTGTRTYTERNITAVKLSSPLHGESVYELSSAEQLKEYLDLTGSVVFSAAPGEEVVVDVVNGGSWVNHYVYIDFLADGFTASIAPGSNYIPADDLVSYSLYNNGGSSDETGCYNSVGESISGDDRSKTKLPSFTLTNESGLYRMRIKQDWCSIDPAGDSNPDFGGTFSNYGGQIIDLMLNVSAGDNTGIEDVETEGGEENLVFDLAGRRIERIAAPGVYIINGKKTVVR